MNMYVIDRLIATFEISLRETVRCVPFSFTYYTNLNSMYICVNWRFGVTWNNNKKKKYNLPLCRGCWAAGLLSSAFPKRVINLIIIWFIYYSLCASACVCVCVLIVDCLFFSNFHFIPIFSFLCFGCHHFIYAAIATCARDRCVSHSIAFEYKIYAIINR